MTQPAFSRRIRALEEWLGAELFDRSSQPAKLTAAGEWFRDRGAGSDGAGGARSGRGARRWPRRTRPRCASPPRTPCRSPSCRVGCAASSRTTTSARCNWSPTCCALRGPDAAKPGAVRDEPRASQGTRARWMRSLPFGAGRQDVLIPVSAPEARGRRVTTLARSAAVAVPVLQYSEESGLGRILRDVRGRGSNPCPSRSSSRRTWPRCCGPWRWTVGAWRGCRERWWKTTSCRPAVSPRQARSGTFRWRSGSTATPTAGQGRQRILECRHRRVMPSIVAAPLFYDVGPAESAATTAPPRIAGTRLSNAEDCSGPEAPIRDLRRLSFAHDVALAVRCHPC